ncbi:MAG: peptidase M20, partial [Pseudomonadota bacterium]|nr:peptidase M20 [Pseudomonadota bacterium]
MRLAPMLRLAALLTFVSATQPASAQIQASRIKEHVRILASDEFLGRGPTQAGDEKTVSYLAQQFQAAGLEPGGAGGSWYQDVPLIRYDRVGPVRISLSVNGASLPLRAGTDITASSRIIGETRLERAPLVFVGYGIDDPSIGWNNYGDMDLTGKVAVFLANDPDFEAAAPGDFGGRTLVFAGRFGAKVEAARRHGAATVLVIHETDAASYPWSQVAN